ncbi:DNA topoisomerase [Cladochytrium replicatum]|nr:DNA topoisomerase [Cladochytrium replicatum]
MPHVKVLCVAEKPSIAKSVAGMLSGGRFVTRATRNKYIKNYEFQLQYGNQPCTIVMTALLGHLMELEFAPAFKNWNTCPPLALFDAPIIKEVRGDMQALKQNLQSEARNSQTLVIWTDCDLEGENIGEEVAIVCQQSNPRLSVKRARFSVVQPREIKQAWDNLVMLDLLQAAAVNARQELDLRIGAAFTRFQTLHAQVRFVELAKKILSYGSCQFPTLGFVVDQYKRHQNFVSEPFWKLEVWVQRGGGDNLDAGSEDDAKFSEEDALPARGRRGRGRGGRGRGGRNQNAQAEPARKGTRFTWARGTLFDEECCSALHALCLDDGGATVIQVSKKPTEKWRPLPLTTVELQKTGSRYLKISSDRVMSIAEKLYNNGYISYPRTETDIFDDNFSLHPLIELQTQDPRWGEYAAGLLSGRFRRPRRGKNNDKAHPPIHPTNAAPDNLSGEELKIFEFVTRRFLACCSENAKGNETIVKIQVASEQFSTTGLMITERNYLDVYPYDKWTSHVIPEFQEGEHLAPIELEMKNGHTTAPQLLTEADLINIMDKSGIGTDATIHEHIKKILEREYAVKANGQYFCPTTLGMALVEAYDSMDVDLAMSKPYLRSQMEASMRGICSGTRQKQEVVHESLEMYRTVFATAMEQADRLEGALSKYLGHDPDQDMVSMIWTT